MATTLLKQKDSFLFVPANLLAVGTIDGKSVPMRIEEIDRRGLFLITKEFVKPRSVFIIEFKTPGATEPLRAIMTASFVERTWNGYGVGAQVSCISATTQWEWERYYNRAAADSTPNFSATFRLTLFLQRQLIVALRGALSNFVCESLRELGVDVKQAETPEAAAALAGENKRALVVARIGEHDPAGRLLRQRLSQLQSPPPFLALVDDTSLSSLDGSLYYGAAKVVARGCSQAMLVTRIVALLQHQQQLAADHDSGTSRESKPVRQGKLATLLGEQRAQLGLHSKLWQRTALAMLSFYFS